MLNLNPSSPSQQGDPSAPPDGHPGWRLYEPGSGRQAVRIHVLLVQTKSRGTAEVG